MGMIMGMEGGCFIMCEHVNQKHKLGTQHHALELMIMLDEPTLASIIQEYVERDRLLSHTVTIMEMQAPLAVT